MKRIKISALILIIMLMVSTSTQATMILDPVRVEVNGIKYDVTSVFGKYIELENELTDINWAPWWGNGPLAIDFAMAVSGSLGYPNGGQDAPYFAYEEDMFSSFFVNSYVCFSGDPTCERFNPLGLSKSGDSYYFAKASAVVPIPAAAWLFMTGLLGLVWKGRRMQ